MTNPVSRIIALFASGSFSAQAARKVQQWIASPAEQEEKEAALRELWDRTEANPTASTRARFDALCGQLEIEIPRKKSGRKRLLWAVPAAAALVAVALWVGLGTQAPQMITVAATHGQSVECLLPDSTHVWLQPGSTLTYPEKFEKGVRRIALEGQGFFRIEADRSWPFEIVVDHMKVVVTGTELNVNAHMDDNNIIVSLCSGKAEVCLTGRDGQADQEAKYALKPNQQLTFDVADGQAQVEDKALAASEWIGGGLIFHDATFSAMLKAVGRHFDVSIEYPAHMPQGRYSVKFIRGESLDECMSLLQNFITDFTYTITDDVLVIHTDYAS